MTTYVSVDLVATMTSQPILSPNGSQSYSIMKASAINAGASNGKITIYRIPAGGVPSVNNALVPGMTIVAGASSPSIFQISGQVVENGKQLMVLCPQTNAAITVSISAAVNPDT